MSAMMMAMLVISPLQPSHTRKIETKIFPSSKRSQKQENKPQFELNQSLKPQHPGEESPHKDKRTKTVTFFFQSSGVVSFYHLTKTSTAALLLACPLHKQRSFNLVPRAPSIPTRKSMEFAELTNHELENA